jgi:hypothetical protein
MNRHQQRSAPGKHGRGARHTARPAKIAGQHEKPALPDPASSRPTPAAFPGRSENSGAFPGRSPGGSDTTRGSKTREGASAPSSRGILKRLPVRNRARALTPESLTTGVRPSSAAGTFPAPAGFLRQSNGRTPTASRSRPPRTDLSTMVMIRALAVVQRGGARDGNLAARGGSGRMRAWPGAFTTASFVAKSTTA